MGLATDSSAQDETEAIGAFLNECIAAFNAKNDQATQELSAYPHVYNQPDGQVTIYERAAEYVTDYEQLVRVKGWARTAIDSFEIVQRSPAKAHVTIAFSSYNEAGERYQSSSALWVLVKQEGRWAVQFRSWLGPNA
jgi:hypothetical protein